MNGSTHFKRLFGTHRIIGHIVFALIYGFQYVVFIVELLKNR
jgi:hypothetical protein